MDEAKKPSVATVQTRSIKDHLPQLALDLMAVRDEEDTPEHADDVASTRFDPELAEEPERADKDEFHSLELADKPKLPRALGAAGAGAAGAAGAGDAGAYTLKKLADEEQLAKQEAKKVRDGWGDGGGGKRSRRKRTKRRRTIGGKKSRKQRKRTTLKGGKRKRRRTRRRR